MRFKSFLERSSVGSLRTSASVSFQDMRAANESLFCKFIPISRDLEIFPLPRIVGQVKRSRLVFIP